ncbi:hypothetical protein CU098_000422, partial [Rhizopus stolonifer]
TEEQYWSDNFAIVTTMMHIGLRIVTPTRARKTNFWIVLKDRTKRSCRNIVINPRLQPV